LSLKIAVLAKQVIDPDMPPSAFKIDSSVNQVLTPNSIPPVVNGFDENAVEAALRIKDVQEASITVISSGTTFALDVMKKPLSMGADELVLLQDELLVNSIDTYMVASVLAAAIKKLGGFDLILCGRQASDWDNAQLPLGLAELLALPCITLGKKVELKENHVLVERVTTDGYEIIEGQLPCVVTVSNELGQPRYPTLRGIMAATRKKPTTWTSVDLGLDVSALTPKISLTDLFTPERNQECEMIEGENEADAAKNLALKLREDKLI
jgi:electron transfer flavoprotein beta subunit